MFKKFSLRAFSLCMLVVIALMIGSFFLYTNLPGQPACVVAFNTLRYPSHLIFGYGAIESWGAFFGGMALNILLFTFIFERVTAIFRRSRKPQAAAPPDKAPPSGHDPY